MTKFTSKFSNFIGSQPEFIDFSGNIANPFLAKTVEYTESDCLTKNSSLFWKEAKPEDLARATLVTITNNIGPIHILRKHL